MPKPTSDIGPDEAGGSVEDLKDGRRLEDLEGGGYAGVQILVARPVLH